MIRVTIGTLMIIGAFISKATLNHNLEYWGSVKTSSIFFCLLGLALLGVPVFEWIEKNKPKTFKANPARWFLFVGKALATIVVVIALSVQVEQLAVWTNHRLVDYYLTRETGTTEGLITGEREVSYRIKTRSYKTFYVIRYVANGQTIEQGLEADYNLKTGQTYKVTYSKEFPSMLRVGNKTEPGTIF